MEFLNVESVGVMKSLLLLLVPFLIPDENLNKWLNHDGFSEEDLKDGSKKYLFNELEKLKKRILYDAQDKTILTDKNGENLNPIEVYNLLEAHKNRIKKVRLMIKFEVNLAINTHKPSGKQYVVARTYWIDKNGNKFKKFSKNIGTAEVFWPTGVIPKDRTLPKHVFETVKKELEKMMWKQYGEEYPQE